MARLELDPQVIAVMKDYVSSYGCTCGDELVLQASFGLALDAYEDNVLFPVLVSCTHLPRCPYDVVRQRVHKAGMN